MEVVNAKDIIEAPLKKKTIEYERATFLSRVFANLLDGIIFIFLFLSLFIGTRTICVNSNSYMAKDAEFTSLKLNSGLFGKDKNNVLRDIVTVIEDAPENTQKTKYILSKRAIDKFFDFANEYVSIDRYQVILNDFADFRISDSMLLEDSNGIQQKMFIINNNEIVENPLLIKDDLASGSSIYKGYYEKCYKKFIDNKLQAYFLEDVRGAKQLQLYEANILIFAEITPSIIISFLLTYLVPPLILKRGRQTLGRLVYHIGQVDSKCLSPSLLRYIAKLGLMLLQFFFAIPTFGVTLIISFSMKVFGKKKQDFPDYVTNITQVRIKDTKIYMNFDEVDIDNIETHKKPVEFTQKIID